MLVDEDLSYRIRGAVYEVYQQLGYGFLEKVYERALCGELSARGMTVRSQAPLAVQYKGNVVGEFFADVLVENRIVLELKAQARLSRSDEAQLLNYLKASNLRVGLLVNFVYPKAQIKRMVF